MKVFFRDSLGWLVEFITMFQPEVQQKFLNTFAELLFRNEDTS